MNSPVFEEENKNKNTGKIIPLYPLTYNLSQNVIRQIIENGLREVNNGLDETLPQYLIEKYVTDFGSLIYFSLSNKPLYLSFK